MSTTTSCSERHIAKISSLPRLEKFDVNTISLATPAESSSRKHASRVYATALVGSDICGPLAGSLTDAKRMADNRDTPSYVAYLLATQHCSVHIPCCSIRSRACSSPSLPLQLRCRCRLVSPRATNVTIVIGPTAASELSMVHARLRVAYRSHVFSCFKWLSEHWRLLKRLGPMCYSVGLIRRVIAACTIIHHFLRIIACSERVRPTYHRGIQLS
ncbi:hypothetical protein V8E55_010271 [Tylopilus felleus]